MNRRDFFTVAGGATALSILGTSSPLRAGENTTPFYIRGLAMLSTSDPQYLRVALPKAPHHSATRWTD